MKRLLSRQNLTLGRFALCIDALSWASLTAALAAGLGYLGLLSGLLAGAFLFLFLVFLTAAVLAVRS